MKKYEITKRIVEISRRDRYQIKEGCGQDSYDPETVEVFDDLEEARKAIKKYKTSISEFQYHGMTYYSVEEYAIEENEYDDADGEFLSGGTIWDCSKMEIEVVEEPGDEVISVCSSLADAERVANEYDGDGGIKIKFSI